MEKQPSKYDEPYKEKIINALSTIDGCNIRSLMCRTKLSRMFCEIYLAELFKENKISRRLSFAGIIYKLK